MWRALGSHGVSVSTEGRRIRAFGKTEKNEGRGAFSFAFFSPSKKNGRVRDYERRAWLRGADRAANRVRVNGGSALNMLKNGFFFF